MVEVLRCTNHPDWYAYYMTDTGSPVCAGCLKEMMNGPHWNWRRKYKFIATADYRVACAFDRKPDGGWLTQSEAESIRHQWQREGQGRRLSRDEVGGVINGKRWRLLWGKRLTGKLEWLPEEE